MCRDGCGFAGRQAGRRQRHDGRLRGAERDFDGRRAAVAVHRDGRRRRNQDYRPKHDHPDPPQPDFHHRRAVPDRCGHQGFAGRAVLRAGQQAAGQFPAQGNPPRDGGRAADRGDVRH